MVLTKTSRTWVLVVCIVGGLCVSCKSESTKHPQSDPGSTVDKPEALAPSASTPAKKPSDTLFAPPQLNIATKDVTEYEYVDETGSVTKARNIAEIPKAHRAQVRVFTEKNVTKTSPYVADLRTEPDPIKAAKVPKYPPETADHAGIELPKIPNKRPATKRTTAKRKPIVIYTTKGCKDCEAAVSWAKKNSVPVTEKSLKDHKSEAIGACKRHGKLCNIAPIILVGGAVMTHFNAKMLDALTRN